VSTFIKLEIGGVDWRLNLARALQKRRVIFEETAICNLPLFETGNGLLS
jgi:hypothetical protein